jgi:Protein of unknown function (DUF2442)
MRQGTRTKKDPAAGIVRVPWRVIDVRALPGHQLFVRFADGTEGEVDARSMVFGEKAGVFERLRDPGKFAEVHVSGGAVTWPGGLDLAPDAMYDEIKANGRWTIKR